ncbi:MAG: Mut7-C RNAse domain-containing protein [Candidatus Thermoplasmatota archaeon]
MYPRNDYKFLCDQMLGTLAKWLRLLGFNTSYIKSGIEDDFLLKIAKEEKRILVTRDLELSFRAKRKNIDVIHIKKTDTESQLLKVLKDKSIKKKSIFSRCTICNTSVEKIEKEQISEDVPDRVFNNNKNFWICPKCEKIYWQGTHCDMILKKVEKINKKLLKQNL